MVILTKKSLRCVIAFKSAKDMILNRAKNVLSMTRELAPEFDPERGPFDSLRSLRASTSLISAPWGRVLKVEG